MHSRCSREPVHVGTREPGARCGGRAAQRIWNWFLVRLGRGEPVSGGVAELEVRAGRSVLLGDVFGEPALSSQVASASARSISRVLSITAPAPQCPRPSTCVRLCVLCVSLAHTWQAHTCHSTLARVASSWYALARHSGFHCTARDALFRAAPPLADSLTGANFSSMTCDTEAAGAQRDTPIPYASEPVRSAANGNRSDLTIVSGRGQAQRGRAAQRVDGRLGLLYMFKYL